LQQVYDFGARKWEFLGEAGHTETIFDCQFKPTNPGNLINLRVLNFSHVGFVVDILATGSFDGCVKLWNISTMKCLDTLNGNEGIVYCVAWSPGKHVLFYVN
jgi:WD repeat-containing protein 17